MFLNFRIPQATYYEMDSKYSRLQKNIGQAKTDEIIEMNDKDGTQRASSRSLLQTNLEHLQKFFSKNFYDGTPSCTDDIQGLLQKGDNDPILPSLTRKQRILGFITCCAIGVLCMAIATLYIPVIVIKARKFATLFSFGSVFFLSSFTMLWGPMNHLKHLINIERLPFTMSYLVTLFGTIYFSVWIQSYFLTAAFALFQIGALIWYIISYIPGGARGWKFFSKLFYTFAAKTVSATLTV
ncbi:unnamed protein product [Adineta ricciae]|uniref:Vesicle transport protein n=1 Tax=Adineta ricciae TaxID=249248 RepID=A0A815ELJ1_ADIRI|nr:unnamed protein product [Adineta ricciae]